MRKFQKIALLLLTVILFSGCRLISPQSPTPTFPAATEAEIIPTLVPTLQTVEPTRTLPTPTVISRPTATSTPFTPQKAAITVENFKLRKGPGFLFDTVGLYDQKVTLLVYGRSQGNGWFFVSTPDYRYGWMKSDYITLSDEVDKLPVIGYRDDNLISGHVQNAGGEPMDGIGIVIFPANSTKNSDQDNAVTDSLGNFYLFEPKDLSGYYTIGVNAYDCKSKTVDSQCQFLYGYPSAQSLSLPHQSDIAIQFVLPNL